MQRSDLRAWLWDGSIPSLNFLLCNRDNTRTPSRGVARTKQDSWSLIYAHFSEVLLILVLWPAVCCQSRGAVRPRLVLAVLRAGGSSWWAHQEALGPGREAAFSGILASRGTETCMAGSFLHKFQGTVP